MLQPRVLLADDHRLLLETFHKLLEPTVEVVGSRNRRACAVGSCQKTEARHHCVGCQHAAIEWH